MMKATAQIISGGCLAVFASIGLAATTDLLDTAQWRIYGTAGMAGGTLTIGDNVGYDLSDSDGDGNPYNVWYEGAATAAQGFDYDDAVTLSAFTAPLTLTWSGCFPVTQYGYNNIVLGKANASFTGAANSRKYPIQQEFGFTARWDYGSTLNTFVNNSGNYAVREVSGATPSNNAFCGDFRIVWTNNVVQFFYNGTKVNEQYYAYTGPVKLVIRSFERPHTLTAISIETGATVQQPPGAANQLMGAMVGNFRGSATDASGNRIQIDASAASVAVDVQVITDDAGNIGAHVSGAGSTFDGSGVSFRFEADYDMTTQALTGTYTDNVDTTPRAIQFTNLSGLNWQARVTGSAISSNGTNYSYDATVDITLPDQALFAGSTFPSDRRFSGEINETQAISVPVSIPQLGINNSYSTNVVVEGAWQATAVPVGATTTITGTYGGAFRFDPPINFNASVSVPYFGAVTVPITIDAVGRFDGTLSGDIASNTLRFSGSWSAVSSEGALGGGTMDMTIPLNQQGGLPSMVTTSFAGSFTRPVSVTGIPAGIGGIPQTYSTPLTVNASVPFAIQ